MDHRKKGAIVRLAVSDEDEAKTDVLPMFS